MNMSKMSFIRILMKSNLDHYQTVLINDANNWLLHIYLLNIATYLAKHQIHLSHPYIFAIPETHHVENFIVIQVAQIFYSSFRSFFRLHTSNFPSDLFSNISQESSFARISLQLSYYSFYFSMKFLQVQFLLIRIPAKLILPLLVLLTILFHLTIILLLLMAIIFQTDLLISRCPTFLKIFTIPISFFIQFSGYLSAAHIFSNVQLYSRWYRSRTAYCTTSLYDFLIGRNALKVDRISIRAQYQFGNVVKVKGVSGILLCYTFKLYLQRCLAVRFENYPQYSLMNSSFQTWRFRCSELVVRSYCSQQSRHLWLSEPSTIKASNKCCTLVYFLHSNCKWYCIRSSENNDPLLCGNIPYCTNRSLQWINIEYCFDTSHYSL